MINDFVLPAIFIGLSVALTFVLPFFKDTGDKLIGGLTIFFWIMSFAYYTKEQSTAVMTGMGLSLPPWFDSPTIIMYAGFIWMLIGIIDATVIYLKVFSDTILADGEDNNQCCVSGQIKYVGDWAWIRVGGTKAIPIPGSEVWVNPKTHIHKIGTHLWLEAQVTPKTTLEYLPFETKRGVRQRRFDSIFGVNKCSVGYLSAEEMATHKEFDTKPYEVYLLPDEKSTKIQNTIDFIEGIAVFNKTNDSKLQSLEHEHSTMTKTLQTAKDMGKASREEPQKGAMQRLFGNG